MEQQERRNGLRIPKMIEINYSSNSPPINARITDLSEKGIFIDTVGPLQAGTMLKFKFSLNDSPSEKPIEGEGKVAWNQQTVGMGIEFSYLSNEDRDRLKNFFNNLVQEYGRIQRMTPLEKLKFARKADRTAREILIRDSNKQIALSILESPRLTEEEVEKFAKSRNISEEVLRAISKKREWINIYPILLSLVNNPKTPLGISIELLSRLRKIDLAPIIRNKGLPADLRRVADRLIERFSQ